MNVGMGNLRFAVITPAGVVLDFQAAQVQVQVCSVAFNMDERLAGS